MTSVRLSDLIEDVQSGFACGDSVDDGVVQLRMNNVDTDGRIDFTKTRRVPESAAKDLERFFLVRGDVMFNNTNSPELVGKSAVFSGFTEPVVFSNHFTRIRVRRDRLEARFLARWLASEWRRGTFARMCNQWVNQASVRKDALLAMEIPTMSVAEQRRIADILDKADAIRQKREEAIALTEELLRSTFLEMFGDPVTNPNGWPVKRFNQLLVMPLRNGLSPSSNGQHAARVLTLSAITRRAYNPSSWKDGVFAVEPRDDVRVDQRDFLICRGNGNKELVGRGAFPDRSDSSLVFPDTMIAARTDDQQVMPAYLSSIWSSSSVREQLEASARTTNGTFKVNQGAIEAVNIVCPPRERQELFQALALRIAQSLVCHQAAHEASDGLFKSIVARAFSGRLSS